MFGSAKKVPTSCPHCGFVQMEPRGLISTYCRGCGDHYSVAAPAPAVPPASTAIRSRRAQPDLTERLREKLRLSRPRSIRCHECGHTHTVPPPTPFTQCPACGTGIELRDITITTHSTRIVQTRGTVHIEKDGFLNATRVDCGHAVVEGRIAGRVTCEGTLRLRGEGLCRALIRTRRLFIDRGGPLRFTSTIYAEEIILRCPVEADIVCAGRLHIGRHGALEGQVFARGMTVDKGGAYSGDVEISPGVELPRPAGRPEPAPRVAPAWSARLAFG